MHAYVRTYICAIELSFNNYFAFGISMYICMLYAFKCTYVVRM